MGQKGMTLIEVLLAVVILSVGLVTVYRALLGSLQTLKYAENRLEGHWALIQKVWEMQDYLERMKKLPVLEDDGAISLGGRNAKYEVEVNPLSADRDFFEIRHRLVWKFQGKNKRIERTGYFLVSRPVEAA